MTFEEWFTKFPWRIGSILCTNCNGTGFRHDDGVLHVPRKICTNCIGDRLHWALMAKPAKPTKH